ncbi:MAG: metal-dependent hydrolase [Planctomycetes bacterium]|nr:metal-dependent hydrolase [Planctomycetota bacterium]
MAASEAKLTWFGHACWGLETQGHRVLVDPFFDESPVAPVKAADVEADFILITHGHFDHIADAAPIANRTGATVVAVFEIAQWLARKHSVAHTIGMNLGGGVDLPFGRVKMTLAFHSSELPDGSYGGSPAGYLIRLPNRTIYFAGDTGLFSDMRGIGDEGLDLAVLPIGDLFTMGPDDALRATEWLRPKQVAPSHYNTWPPIAQDAAAWADRVRRSTAAVPKVVEPGQSFTL